MVFLNAEDTEKNGERQKELSPGMLRGLDLVQFEIVAAEVTFWLRPFLRLRRHIS